MQPITGNASITFDPMTIAKPAPPETFLGVAENLLPGVAILVASGSQAAVNATALLCGHIVECVLKAYLLRTGPDPERKVRHHNLVRLWNEAVSEGLAVQNPPPGWLECLNRLHDAPYNLRYAEHVHALVFPPLQEMGSEVSALFANVRSSVTQENLYLRLSALTASPTKSGV